MLILTFFFLLAFLGSIFVILHVPNFTSTPHPAASYEEALKKFSAIEKQEAALPLSPEGHSRLMVHGTKTESVFVLLHGLSSCPQQWVPLATLLFDRGANAVILRARDAGHANIFNKKQNEQSGQDLVDQAATSLDIAAGLGDQVILVGLSAGALGASWMAQHRDGIDRVVLISPFFSPYQWSVPVCDIVMSLLARLPNFYIWKKGYESDPSYVYPGYGTQCVAKTLQLSRAIRSFQGPLKAGQMDILFSGADLVVNRQLIEHVVKKWSDQNPGKVFKYEFPASLGIGHDCIDPNKHDSKTERSYPVILNDLSPSA
ncbi:MAG: alpha/beta hydrolase [Chthoniobacterales bacterium]